MEIRPSNCRVCLSEAPDGLELFAGGNEAYLNLLNELMSVQITQEALWPSRLCTNCCGAMDSISELRDKFEDTQQSLQSAQPVLLIRDRVPRSRMKKTQPPEPQERFIEEEEEEPLPEEAVDPIPEDIQVKQDESEDQFAEEDEQEDRDDEDYKDESVEELESPRQRPVRATRTNSAKKDTAEQQNEKYSREALEQMMRDRDLLKCPLCAQNEGSFALLHKHMQTTHNSRGYFICCNKKQDRREAHDHMLYHLDKETFKCGVCGKQQKSALELKAHTELSHPSDEEKVFACDTCGKAFNKKYLLNNHKKFHLSYEDREFKCPECTLGFNARVTLDKHIRKIHRKEVEVCEQCGKGFTSNSGLKTHLKTAHQDQVTERCDRCGKYVFNLKVHQKSCMAPKETCEICGKLVAGNYLSIHMRNLHTNRQQFECDICQKKFNLKSNLKTHKNTHFGIKSKCHFCPVEATDSGNLVKHMTQAHPQEYKQYKESKFRSPRVRLAQD